MNILVTLYDYEKGDRESFWVHEEGFYFQEDTRNPGYPELSYCFSTL